MTIESRTGVAAWSQPENKCGCRRLLLFAEERVVELIR